MIEMKFDDYGVEVAINNNGNKQFKYLSFPKFQQIVLQQYNFNSGIMPLGSVAYKKSGKGEALAVIQPGHSQQVKYELFPDTHKPQIHKFTVPLPPLLWIYKLTIDKRLSGTYVYSLKKPVVFPGIMLYSAPFSNVGNDGGICWGSGSELLERPFKTLSGLTYLPTLFFTQPFNHDLDHNLSIPAKDGLPTLAFFRDYNNKVSFPFNILREYRKFEEVWNEI